MDVQSGESKEEEVMGEGIGDLEMEELVPGIQDEIDEEIKGVNSRDKVKQNGGSSQLFLEKMMKMAEQE